MSIAKLTFAAAFALLPATVAGATDTSSGNYFKAACTGKEAAKELFCSAFITGVYTGFEEGMRFSASREGRNSVPLLFCRPKGAPRGQLKAVVIKFLENNPEKLHISFDLLVIQALTEAFPCKGPVELW